MLVLASCQTPSLQAPPVPQAVPSEFVAGQLLVKFRPEVKEAERAALRKANGVTTAESLLPDLEHWQFKGDTLGMQKQLSHNPSLLFVEPNFVRRTLAFAPSERSDSSVDQWYLGAARGIDMAAAWTSASFANATNSAQPGAGVTVAVVDTGVDTNHPDLRAHIPDDPQAPTNRAPWGKKFIDEVGHDSTVNTGSLNFLGQDGNGHGTHVAGILGAIGYNSGIVGVAPGVTILPVKVMRADGNGDDAQIAKGLIDAADAGAEVINLSVGGPDPSQTLAAAIAYDFSKGATVVIASGNYGGPVLYPAAYAGVIAVGATSGAVGSPNAIPDYSSRGPQLSLVAPGGEGLSMDAAKGIYSTFPTHDTYLSVLGRKPKNYAVQSGTSMATPIVSGVAALVIADAKAHGQTLTPSQVRARLLATATPLAISGFDNSSGYGLVNPAKALLWSAPGGAVQ